MHQIPGALHVTGHATGHCA